MGRYTGPYPKELTGQGGSRPSLAFTCGSIGSPLNSILSPGHKVWDHGYSGKIGLMCVA